ncbi:holin family protein [Lentibacter algarum]|uniref:holin family protein n=1 Tax=Lentibacter algarum TaxID=576131 RepID=UPI001C096DD2|nr:holin family protein [Lentibacter algarum]MBU2982447.1 holin family protein [Lentibacter algarum]
MGLIGQLFSIMFGSGSNVVKDTAEVFRENAEAGAVREAMLRSDALAQYSREFAQPKRGVFDALMDAINRLPRPLMALGTIGLFVSAMTDPVWFGERMQGIALVPEPLWWILGAVISFYFGARHQLKGQEFQTLIGQSLGRLPQARRNATAINGLSGGALTPGKADTAHDATLTQQTSAREDNLALNDWRNPMAGR